MEGKISNNEIEDLLYERYSIENGKIGSNDKKLCECDIVSNRIVKLLETDGFMLHPSTLKSIHKYLFKDIYEFAGKFRTTNISKKEKVLNGASVKYCNYFMMEDTLNYDFDEIGFSVDNDLFKDNAVYFRDALVRANYADFSNRIDVKKSFLYQFFENLLFEGRHLLNDNMQVPEINKQEP